MLRYHEELRLRRQLTRLQLTLMLESVGIKQVLSYPGSPRRKRCQLAVGFLENLGGAANALSYPPGEYGRKIKTQMN